MTSYTFNNNKVIILIVVALLNTCHGQSEEVDEMKHLLENGDSVSIVSKNSTADAQQLDVFDQYLNSHVIRIKSPFDQSKFYDFELKHFVRDDTVEGRKKRVEGLMRFLLPIFMAIKMKLHSLVVLMAFVAGIAIKGFVAGATGLLLSKLIGLKLLLQKSNEEKDEDYQQDDHDGEGEKPIVLYLNSDQKWAKNGYEGHPTFKKRYYPYARNWDKYENLRKEKWENLPYWGQQPWR